jgi:hypothetical protein
MLLELCVGLTIPNLTKEFKMKTQETLNTKHVDIFLRFPMNICVPHANKPSNGYGHWKIAQGKIFDKKLETN